MTRDYAFIASTVSPFVDVFLCETMSCIREATFAATAARDCFEVGARPVWVSFTLADGDDSNSPVPRLRSGEDLASAVRAIVALFPGGPLEGTNQNFLDAILFNCSSPEVIALGIMELQKLRTCSTRGEGVLLPTGVKIGGYPNAFRPNLEDGYEQKSAIQYSELAQEWVGNAKYGAEVVGGCCGIFPEHVAAMGEGLVLNTTAPSAEEWC